MLFKCLGFPKDVAVGGPEENEALFFVQIPISMHKCKTNTGLNTELGRMTNPREDL